MKWTPFRSFPRRREPKFSPVDVLDPRRRGDERGTKRVMAMRRWLITSAVVAMGLVTMWPPAFAYDPDHLAQLLATNQCAGCDLGAADLSEANLAFADLRGANLEAARLDRASLICTRLEGASLIDADLHGANVMGALFEGADLTGANLRGATLLRNALWEATRDDVILDGAVFFRSMSDAGLWNVDCRDGEPTLFGG